MLRTMLCLSCAMFLFAGACSHSNVKPVYKPSQTDVFVTTCTEDKQLCYKDAREHCDGDFEVLDTSSTEEDGEAATRFEFRCI